MRITISAGLRAAAAPEKSWSIWTSPIHLRVAAYEEVRPERGEVTCRRSMNYENRAQSPPACQSRNDGPRALPYERQRRGRHALRFVRGAHRAQSCRPSAKTDGGSPHLSSGGFVQPLCRHLPGKARRLRPCAHAIFRSAEQRSCRRRLQCVQDAHGERLLVAQLEGSLVLRKRPRLIGCSALSPRLDAPYR